MSDPYIAFIFYNSHFTTLNKYVFSKFHKICVIYAFAYIHFDMAVIDEYKW